jgi:hypothetical protein
MIRALILAVALLGLAACEHAYGAFDAGRFAAPLGSTH